MKKTSLFLYLLCTFASCKSEPAKTPIKTGLMIERINGKDVAKKYYDDGKLQTQGEVMDSTIKNGLWKYWYDTGVIWSECTYQNGIKEGETKVYYKSGALKYKGVYRADKPSGTWTFYNEDGSVAKEVNHD